MPGMSNSIQPDHRQVRQFQRLFVHLCRAAQGAYDQKRSNQQQDQKLYERQSTPQELPLLPKSSQLLLPASSPLLSFHHDSVGAKEAQDAAVAAALQQYQQIREKKLAQTEHDLEKVEERYHYLSRQPNMNRGQLQKLEAMITSLRQMIQQMKKK